MVRFLCFGRLRIGVGEQKDVLGVLGVRGEHLGAVDDPRVSVTRRAGLAGGDVGAALGFGVAQAQPDLAGEHSRQHRAGESSGPNCCTNRATTAVVPQWYHGVWARPISRWKIRRRTALNPPSESSLPIRGQIPRFAQRQMHFLIEVFAELTIAPQHLVGDVFSRRMPASGRGRLVLGRKSDVGEVHLDRRSGRIETRVRKRSRVSSACAMLSPGRWTLTQVTPSFASFSRPSR